ncbi:unnamed protein product [Amaranthus hypochondriacus]
MQPPTAEITPPLETLEKTKMSSPSAPPHTTPNEEVKSTWKVPTASGQWSTGLCECHSDISNCFITCLCPCITFGQISEIVDRGTSSCAINGAIYTLLAVIAGIPCIYSCFYRRRLRNEFNLNGNSCTDFCTHFCCELCSLCQEYRELKLRGFDMGLGWHANMENRHRQSTMIPPPYESMTR